MTKAKDKIILKEQGQLLIYELINPLIKLLIKLRVTPNVITSIGFVLNLLATVIFILGAELGARNEHAYIGWAGAVILFAGLFDMIDGRLARLGNMAHPFGALYDSVVDRYSELIMFLGICYYLVSHDYFLSSIFAFVAMIGSMMVSYTRARAEGLGVSCSIGIMQRPERVLLVGISAILCGLFSYFVGSDIKVEIDFYPYTAFETISVFTFPLAILAVMANITAIRRLNFSRKVLMERSEDKARKNA
ncbi:MAG: CDP-alcohol phosphatidyltransferase family protein [Bacteroidota bacterium]